MTSLQARASLAGALVYFTLASCAVAPPEEVPANLPKGPETILFVGNSFTFWRGGLWKHMDVLTAARGEGSGAKSDRVVRGGASLEVMWKRTKAKDKIIAGDYDVVVLQEDLPETKVESFHEYASKFDALVRESGARSVFFMAWDYERLGWISMDEIMAEHSTMSGKLGAEVAPVGMAWYQAMNERPELDMYGKDREHPSAYGTHLSLLVIYATIYGESPEGLDYAPPTDSGITAEEDAFLRRIAGQAVRTWKRYRKGVA